MQVLLRLPRPLVDKIETARGPMTRTDWMRLAAEKMLDPIAVFRDPMLDQTPHMHTPGRLVGTQFKGGVKIRTYQCADTDCEMEVIQ